MGFGDRQHSGEARPLPTGKYCFCISWQNITPITTCPHVGGGQHSGEAVPFARRSAAGKPPRTCLVLVFACCCPPSKGRSVFAVLSITYVGHVIKEVFGQEMRKQ